MRLAAQAKLGFYPAAPEAVAELTRHLSLAAPNPEKKFDTFQIIDPCAGQGLAIQQIAEHLRLDASQVYAVELDPSRAEAVRANIPGVNLLGPASFLGVQITGFSFGLAYVNPPFDNELGGGRREEQAFTEKAARLLVTHGVLVLVCPASALAGNSDFVQFLDANFEQVGVYKFPDGHRPYNEIAVIGRKRRQTIPSDTLHQHGTLHKMGLRWRTSISMDQIPSLGQLQPVDWINTRPTPDREACLRVYEIPTGWRPSTFKKIEFTDQELQDAIAGSPLNKHFREVEVTPPQAPPLPLDKGHLGLILASGMLDGVVEGPHGVHVVRGSSHKVEYHNKEASTSEENPDTGAVTTKDVFSQRMVTVIRCVDEAGVIYTHSNAPQKDEEDADPEGDQASE